MELSRLPGKKKEPHESTKEVAERILSRLRFAEYPVTWNFERTEVFEEEDDSESYPGMRTVYRKEIVEGHMTNTDLAMLQRIGACTELHYSFDIHNPSGLTNHYQWLTERQCLEKDISLTAPTEGEYVSCLVRAPVGLEEEALGKYLEENGVDLSRFGEANSKNLGELADELIKGESALIRQPDGLIKRVVDVVLLRLVKADSGEVLIEESERFPDGETLAHNRLPGGKRRPDENQFLAAKRLVARNIKVDPNYIGFNKNDVRVVEEETNSNSFPGLRTLYRKRILSAQIHPPSAYGIGIGTTSEQLEKVSK